MTAEVTFTQGTAEWFAMVGELIRHAADEAGLPSDFNLTVVERYSDGVQLDPGLVQGIRLSIDDGRLSYRVGVSRDEQADIVVEITAAGARKLNMLYRSDPAYRQAQDNLQETGEMRVTGDPSRLGAWFAAVHDPIVDRTD